jgi:nucleoside-diphosphate-sugar epimerase
VVVHLAGLAHLTDETAAAAADTFARVNVEGTARLAAAAVGSGVRRFVLMSSALVHGQASLGRPFLEDDAPAPETPYGRSKLDSEIRLMETARGSALEWVILRPPMVYGPGARGNFRRLVQLVRAGVPLPLGAATAPRSFIGIDNLADAVVRAVEHPRAANQVLLVADAETTSTVGLVHLIAAGLGRRIWTPHVPAALLRTALGAMGRTRDVQRLFDPLELNTSRIRALLEWTPPVTLAEGVRRAVKD